MKRLAPAFVAAFLCAPLFSVPASHAATDVETVPELLNFDLNNNGLIDPEEVTPEFLRFINNVFMPKVPWRAPEPVAESVAEPVVETGEEAAPPAEAAPAEAAPVEAVPAPEKKSLPKGEEIKPVEPAPVPEGAPEAENKMVGEAAAAAAELRKPSKITARLLLRRKVEDVTLNKKAKALDAADGAVVSYTSDYKQQTEEWQVQGALLAPIRYATGREIVPGHRVLSAYTFVPSVSFDRKFHSTDTGSEINTLAFRAGSEFEVSGGRLFPVQYFRISPVYATDFDFESAVVAGELQYEPVKESWGLGEPILCFWGNLECQWRAIIHMEGGKTLDAGDKTNLVEDEEFLRAGPILSATLRPQWKRVERLELSLGLTYLEELNGGDGASDLFESALAWRLDDNGHIRLRAQYRHGDLALTRDKVSIFTTGLEVKF